MKITNLSVGDWVMVDGEDWKVSAINSDSVGLRVGNDYAMAEISECDGILITPEILEKNGFVRRDTYIWSNPKMRCAAYRFGLKYWDVRVTYRARGYRPTRINIQYRERRAYSRAATRPPLGWGRKRNRTMSKLINAIWWSVFLLAVAVCSAWWWAIEKVKRI